MIHDSENGALMSCLYAGSVRHYAAMVAAGRVAFDIDSPVGKCREVNRTRIIGANGVQTLTIPLVKPAKGGVNAANALPVADVPYYQVWNARHGFVPGLSILDLVLNEGRCATLVLNAMCSIHLE